MFFFLFFFSLDHFTIDRRRSLENENNNKNMNAAWRAFAYRAILVRRVFRFSIFDFSWLSRVERSHDLLFFFFFSARVGEQLGESRRLSTAMGIDRSSFANLRISLYFHSISRPVDRKSGKIEDSEKLLDRLLHFVYVCVVCLYLSREATASRVTNENKPRRGEVMFVKASEALI